MKKFLKIFGIISAAIVGLAAIIGIVGYFNLNRQLKGIIPDQLDNM